jgi:hypothetical protein
VAGFIEAQALQASSLYMAPPTFIGWNPADVVPGPSETVPTQEGSSFPGDRAASRSIATIHHETAFAPDVSEEPELETESGFFGEQ